ncbi:MAG: response regulator [Chitinophagaceae bacterium]|nr:response regulator [Chitinophagaceae bacterium]
MRKILIVDDSIELLEVMDIFLTKRNFEVQTVTNKADLLQSIQSFKPDLIILDVYLMGEDGREICKELRHYEKTRYLCIMIFSASTTVLKDYQECGADGFIEKPFGLNDILEKIESVIEHCKDKVVN